MTFRVLRSGNRGWSEVRILLRLRTRMQTTHVRADHPRSVSMRKILLRLRTHMQTTPPEGLSQTTTETARSAPFAYTYANYASGRVSPRSASMRRIVLRLRTRMQSTPGRHPKAGRHMDGTWTAPGRQTWTAPG